MSGETPETALEKSGRDAETHTMESADTLNLSVRPRCARCDRLAVTFDPDETPLCARHATIFMTVDQPDDSTEDEPAT